MTRPHFKYYTAPIDEIPATAIYALKVDTGISDVSGETLHQKGHPIPITPDYKTWRSLVQAKQKCGRCFATVRGQNDLDRHNSINHFGSPAYLPR